MKWLKVFEDFGDKVIELEMDDYYSKIRNSEFDSFTDYESSLLIKLLNIPEQIGTNIKWEHPIDSVKFGKSGFNIWIFRYLPNRHFVITILKKEDSWFLVHIIDKVMGTEKYYKCDQMEGLIELIKETI